MPEKHDWNKPQKGASAWIYIEAMKSDAAKKWTPERERERERTRFARHFHINVNPYFLSRLNQLEFHLIFPIKVWLYSAATLQKI